METTLDEVAFVARSHHRMRVLEALADGPRGRRDLHETVGVSQPTLGRILGSFQSLGWIERTDGVYALTPCGTVVTAELVDLQDAVAATRRLRPIARWLPLSEMGVDLRRFVDARVTTPGGGDSVAPLRRVADLVRTADEVRLVAGSATRDTTEAYRDAAAHDVRLEAVVSATAVDVIESDEAMAREFREALAADRTVFYRYDGSVPYVVLIGTAAAARTAIGAVDSAGVVRGLVETDDNAVRSWAETVLDRYRTDAERLVPEAVG